MNTGKIEFLGDKRDRSPYTTFRVRADDTGELALEELRAIRRLLEDNLVHKRRDDGGMTDQEIVTRMEEFIFRATGERLNLTGEERGAS